MSMMFPRTLSFPCIKAFWGFRRPSTCNRQPIFETENHHESLFKISKFSNLSPYLLLIIYLHVRTMSTRSASSTTMVQSALSARPSKIRPGGAFKSATAGQGCVSD